MSDDGPARAKRPPAPQSKAVGTTLFVLVAVVAAVAILGSSKIALALLALGAPAAVYVAMGFAATVRLIFLATFFLAPLSSLQPIHPPPVLTFADVTFAVGMVIITPQLLRQRLVVPPLYLIGLAVLLPVSVLSIALHDAALTSIPGAMRIIYAVVVLPFVLLLWRPSEKRIVELGIAYVAGSCLSIVDGLIKGPGGDGRYLGLTDHPNALALSVLLSVGLLPYLASRVRRHRWLLLVAGGFCVYGVWISGSRAALLVLMIGILIYAFWERVPWTIAAIMLGACGILLAWNRISKTSGSSALARLIGDNSSSYSDNQRTDALHTALNFFTAHPLTGAGYSQMRAAQDVYLQLLAALGLFALVGFVFLLATLIFPLWTRKPRRLLGYPPLMFAILAPLTDVVWDFMLWSVMALCITAWLKPDDDDPDEALQQSHPQLVEAR